MEKRGNLDGPEMCNLTQFSTLLVDFPEKKMDLDNVHIQY